LLSVRLIFSAWFYWADAPHAASALFLGLEDQTDRLVFARRKPCD
jgi:hypothetical protein